MDHQFKTPVLFLIFNRPDTTQQVFNQIRQIKPKYLYVAADGPRLDKLEEIEKCSETRSIIKQIDWECELKTLFRENNLGCALAVTSAITWFFDFVDEGIILEDDCYPDITFFLYCQGLLEKYRNNTNIYLIGGISFQKSIKENNADYYFTNYAQIWGWASWKRAWYMHKTDYFDYDIKNSSKNLQHIFNSKSEKKYWNQIFNKCKNGKISTWDYQWLYFIWKNKGISIAPNMNLVVNIGFKNNSTNYFLNDSYKSELKCNQIKFPLVHPLEIKIDNKTDIFTYENLYSHSFKRLFRLYKENKLKSLIKYYLRKLN